MAGSTANRSLFERVVCILSVALVCAMGVVQAVHVHPQDSTAASHHACSICIAAHAGVSVETGAAAPVLSTTALAATPQETSAIFRSVASYFIRPPPAF